MRAPRALVGAVLASAVCASALATAAGAAEPQMIPTSSARVYLQYSAWATQNHADVMECAGVGAGKKRDVVTVYASFRCTIQVRGVPSGSIVAKALGPEWLRVVRITGGKLSPDRGIGKIPVGPASVDSAWAGSALERSSWGTSNDVDTAMCAGVGAYKELPAQIRFFAFSCATLNTFASRGPHVLITISPKGAVTVVRTLAS